MSQDAKRDPTYGSSQNVDTFSVKGDNAPENLIPDGRSLIQFLCDSLAILWKDWSRDMRVNVLDADSSRFSLRGKCPHCAENSVFILVTNVNLDAIGGSQYRVTGAMQCQGCDKYILGMVLRQNGPWNYIEHYPIGTPDASVNEHVPPNIASDFSEALRCLWIGSYKATVAMCRRSVEASCHERGAVGANLYARIDDLAGKGIITDPLRRMAHRVRLAANQELHGEPDDLNTFGEPDAKAMTDFVREYFHHVYVMPALLEAFDNPQGEAAGVDEL